MPLHCDLGHRAEHCPTRINPVMPPWPKSLRPTVPRLSSQLGIPYQTLRYRAGKLFPGKSLDELTHDDIDAIKADVEFRKVRRKACRRR